MPASGENLRCMHIGIYGKKLETGLFLTYQIFMISMSDQRKGWVLG
jgi:hypothetical protein